MIAIVVPAYNEETKIVSVINDLNNHGYHHIIVVDDCSTDNTKKVAEATGVTVLHHIINRDQGAALRTGILYALKQGASMIVTFDSDGQHHAFDLPRMIETLKKRNLDVVLGSRFLKKNNTVPFIRKLFLKGGVLLMNIMYNMKVTDAHNGLRVFSRKAAIRVNFKSDKKEHASEIIELIGKRKLRYCEVPVTISYTDYSTSMTREHAQSNWNAFHIFFKMVLKKVIR